MLVVEFLLPSWWEVQISVVAAAFVVMAYFFFLIGESCSCGDGRRLADSSTGGASVNDDREEIVQFEGDLQTNSAYLIKVELLAAKILNGANLNGPSDSFALITCGGKKRFSSMVPSSRNPMWREEFNFSIDELPVEIIVTIYAWDTIRRCTILGSVTTTVEHEGQTGAIWYSLEGASGKVCLHIKTLKLQMGSSRCSNSDAGANTRRLALDKLGPMVLHQKHGPLQMIFNLLPDEVVEHSYSCALEKSFLFHGRMYISARHICFHSNVFSKKMKVIISFEDIDEIKRSQHALINPAITIILRVGSGGHGVPPLGNSDGRVRYKFASFWNRNQALRALQHSVKNYHAMLEADKKEEQSPRIDFVKGKEQSTLLDIPQEKQRPALLEFVNEEEQSALHGDSSSVRDNESQSKIPVQVLAKPKKFQPFIKEEMLTRVYNDVFPWTVEQFFKLILDDDSTFTMEFHTAIKDFNLTVGQWCTSDEYNGQVRKVTYRRLSKHPACDPEMQMTESQHSVLSADKKTLVFETSLVTEGVPFGSHFEAHAKWTVEANSQSSCTVDIGFGLYFKKWCIFQSKIKAVGLEENKTYYKTMSDAARSYIMSRISNTEIDSVGSPVAIQESN